MLVVFLIVFLAASLSSWGAPEQQTGQMRCGRLLWSWVQLLDRCLVSPVAILVILGLNTITANSKASATHIGTHMRQSTEFSVQNPHARPVCRANTIIGNSKASATHIRTQMRQSTEFSVHNRHVRPSCGGYKADDDQTASGHRR